MTTDPRFGWTEFYMEFASKLLAHYNDRTRLVEAVHTVCDRLNFRYFRKDQYADGSVGPVQDICPFTTMGTFNRGIVAANKHRIADELRRFLNVGTSAPESFDGIPVLNNQKSWFFRYAKDRGENDIDVLWDVFANAIQLANNDSDRARREFVDSYDSAIALPQVSLNLTIGLYWLRPHRFLTLDRKSRVYIAGELGITLPGELPPSGSEYLELVDRVKERISDHGSPLHSFPELAWAADEPNGTAATVPSPAVWLVRAGREGEYEDDALKRGLAIVDWSVGDLTGAVDRDGIRERVRHADPSASSRSIGNVTGQLASFLLDLVEGDIVSLPLKTRSGHVALGRVTGQYVYRAVDGHEFHTRSVNWIRTDVPLSDFGADLQSSLGYSGTICRIQGNDAERRIAAMLDDIRDPGMVDGPTRPPFVREYTIDNIMAEGCFLQRAKVDAILSRFEMKKNLILQGPPGTGKTWLAKRLAFALIGQEDHSRVRRLQFHPNLSYEDFIRGFRPHSDGKLELVDGPFLELIKEARSSADNDYVMVIEEINRGNPAQIFGEMLTLLEADKRDPGEALRLAHAKDDAERVYIPENVYVVGTMNVADRSIALVDLALRRRFAFVDLEPTFTDVWRDWVREKCGIDPGFLADIKERMTRLNDTIAADNSLGPQFRIGHSYVTPVTKIDNPGEWFKQVVETEIGPLLDEYWFDDLEKAKDAKTGLLSRL